MRFCLKITFALRYCCRVVLLVVVAALVIGCL